MDELTALRLENMENRMAAQDAKYNELKEQVSAIHKTSNRTETIVEYTIMPRLNTLQSTILSGFISIFVMLIGGFGSLAWYIITKT